MTTMLKMPNCTTCKYQSEEDSLRNNGRLCRIRHVRRVPNSKGPIHLGSFENTVGTISNEGELSSSGDRSAIAPTKTQLDEAEKQAAVETVDFRRCSVLQFSIEARTSKHRGHAEITDQVRG